MSDSDSGDSLKFNRANLRQQREAQAQQDQVNPAPAPAPAPAQDAMPTDHAAKRKRVESPDEFGDDEADFDALITATDAAERSTNTTPSKPARTMPVTTTIPKTPSRTGIPRNGLVLASEARNAASEKSKPAQWAGNVGSTGGASGAPVPAKKTPAPSPFFGGMGAKPAPTTPTGPRATPTAARTFAAPPATPATPSTPGSGVHDPTSNIMKLLEGTPISAAVRSQVQAHLETYGRQVHGVINGRNMARAVAKGQAEKIAELERKLADQEEMLKFKNEQITFKNEQLRVKDVKVRELESKLRGR